MSLYMNGIEYAPFIAVTEETLEKVCYGEQALQYEVGKNALEVTTYLNDYVEYDSENRQFTVLKDFVALITVWVMNYKSSTLAPSGQLYINDVRQSSYTATSAANSKGGKTIDVELHQGDIVYVKTPNDDGWPTQRIKIYKTQQGLYNLFLEAEAYGNEVTD